MAFFSQQDLAARCQRLSTDECLRVCRDAVVLQLEGARSRNLLCSVSVEATHSFLQSEERAGRFHPGTTKRWLAEIEEELGRDAITKRIQAASRHRIQLATSEAIVLKQWNVGLYDILVDNPFAKTISESLAKRLAQLSLVLPLQDARAAIRNAIIDRQRTTTSGLGHVCNRDIDSILSRFPRDEKGRPQRATTPSMPPTPAIPTPTPQHHRHQEEEDVEKEDVEEEDIADAGSDSSGASQERQEEPGAPGGHAHQVVNNDVAGGSQNVARGPEVSKTAGNDQEELKRTEVDHPKHQDDRQDSTSTSLDWCTSDSDNINSCHPGEAEALRPIHPNAVGDVTRRKRKAQGDRLYRPTKRTHSPIPPAALARRAGPSLPFITDVEDPLEESSPSGHIDRGPEESSTHGDDTASKRRYSSLPPIELARGSGLPLSFVTDMEDSMEVGFSTGQRDDAFSEPDPPRSIAAVSLQNLASHHTEDFPITPYSESHGWLDPLSSNNTGIPIEQGHYATEDASINSPGDAASHMSLESISLLGQQQQGEIKNEDRHVATDPLPSPRLFASLAALSRREKFNAETLMMILRLLPKGNCELVDPAQVKPQAKRLAESHTRQMKRVAVSPVTVLVYNDEEACHWSVGIFRSGLHTIHYFDSMSSLGVEAKARQACLGTLEWLGISVKDIVWEAKSCIQQSDGVSCGLYLIENVRAVLAADAMPVHLNLDELRSSLHQQLSVSETNLQCYAMPAAAIHPLAFPRNPTPPTIESADSIILSKKLEQQQNLVAQANEQRHTLLQQVELLNASDAELLQLHTELMDAESGRLWYIQNYENTVARLEVFESRPSLRPPSLRMAPTTDGLSEYTDQLGALRRRVEQDQSQQQKAVNLMEQKKTAWHTHLELHKDKFKQFKEAVKLWEAWFKYTEDHSRLLGI